MDQYKFVERIKTSGIDADMQRYREELFSPINERERESVSARFKESIQSLDKEQQEFFMSYIKIIAENSIGFILSVLDGSTNIGDSGGQFQLYYDEENGARTHVNSKDGDMLMTLFLDEDEDA